MKPKSALHSNAALEAAQRLAKSLPVHEHKLEDDRIIQAGVRTARSVRIGVIVYPSLRQAADANGVSITSIYGWIRTGEAEYI